MAQFPLPVPTNGGSVFCAVRRSAARPIDFVFRFDADVGAPDGIGFGCDASICAVVRRFKTSLGCNDGEPAADKFINLFGELLVDCLVFGSGFVGCLFGPARFFLFLMAVAFEFPSVVVFADFSTGAGSTVFRPAVAALAVDDDEDPIETIEAESGNLDTVLALFVREAMISDSKHRSRTLSD